MSGADQLIGDEQPQVFAWSGGRVVLLAERAGSSWVVARGWRRGDRLVDIRRWSFATPRLLAGQVRRLVREAAGDHRDADAAASALLAWAERQARESDGPAHPSTHSPLAPRRSPEEAS